MEKLEFFNKLDAINILYGTEYNLDLDLKLSSVLTTKQDLTCDDVKEFGYTIYLNLDKYNYIVLDIKNIDLGNLELTNENIKELIHTKGELFLNWLSEWKTSKKSELHKDSYNLDNSGYYTIKIMEV